MTSVQEAPQIFTLLTVLCVLLSLITFAAAAYRAIRGRRASAVTLLVGWGFAAVVYVLISASVSFFKPRRIIEQGQNWCFDDWCIAVERVSRTPASDRGHSVYTTDVRVFNAARSPEGARNFWVYLRDDDDRRYAPMPGSWTDVVAARVGPHEFARTSIAFVVPDGVGELGLVTGHGGGSPCGLIPSLIEIGQGACLFHRPNMIRIQ
jgi:hypothetical protein